MPDTGSISTRLYELKRRFEEEPSSPVFLQLAEEYRRVGRSEEALEVLTAGLERNPGYLSAQVAMGRCYLDLGRGAEAQALLSAVLERDPAHLVASKLLIEAHLLRGDGVLARRQLDLYSALAPGDVEIDELRRRIDSTLLAPAIEEQPGAGWTYQPPPATPQVAPMPGGARVQAQPQAQPFEPFPGLALRLDRASYRRRLATEGLLGHSEEAQPPHVSLAGLAEPVLEETRPGVAARDADPAAPAVVEPLEAPFEAPLPEPEAFAPEPSSRWDEPIVLTPPSLSPQADDEATPATVTLGELYLRQGHSEEAGKIFLRVLEREPENAQALAGLKEVAQVLGPLPEPRAAGGEPAVEADPLKARVALYRRLLDGVRASRNRNAS